MANPGPEMVNNAMNVTAFVDGHANYIKFYFDGSQSPCLYNPPSGYDYQWGENGSGP